LTAFQLELQRPITGSASFSADRTMRWRLGRVWDPGLPQALVLGYNPSAAGAEKNDPMVLRWNFFFGRWGFGGYTAMNKYPVISSDPAECWRWAAPQLDGRQPPGLFYGNVDKICEAASAASKVFVCWGKCRHQDDEDWSEYLIDELFSRGKATELWCFGTNIDGSPKHPMARGRQRIPDDQRPVLWRAL
jgi:hypothetical protein